MNIGEETVQLGENAPMTNDWFDDNLSFSSDFDVDAIKIEEGGTYFQRDDKSHSNCVSKQEYEKEKKNWEDSMTEITQRYNRATSMLDSMKSIVSLKCLLFESTIFDFICSINKFMNGSFNTYFLNSS